MQLKVLLDDLVKAACWSPFPPSEYKLRYWLHDQDGTHLVEEAAEGLRMPLAMWNLFYVFAPEVKAKVITPFGDGPHLEALPEILLMLVEDVPISEWIVQCQAEEVLDFIEAVIEFSDVRHDPKDWERWIKRARTRLSKGGKSATKDASQVRRNL